MNRRFTANRFQAHGLTFLALYVVLLLLPSCPDDGTSLRDLGLGDGALDGASAGEGGLSFMDTVAWETQPPSDQALETASDGSGDAPFDGLPDGPSEGGLGDADFTPGILACAKIIGFCGASKTYSGFISPFTQSTCENLLSCLNGYYTGACKTKYLTYLSCVDYSIFAKGDCDAQCLTELADVQSSCPCAATCGMSCP